MLASSPSHSTASRLQASGLEPAMGEAATALERCRYPSKVCRATRTLKSNGTLHRYCHYHRQKANVNQKRWVHRQRCRSSVGSDDALELPEALQLPPPEIARPQTPPFETPAPSSSCLSEYELDVLCALLFSDSTADATPAHRSNCSQRPQSLCSLTV